MVVLAFAEAVRAAAWVVLVPVVAGEVAADVAVAVGAGVVVLAFAEAVGAGVVVAGEVAAGVAVAVAGGVVAWAWASACMRAQSSRKELVPVRATMPPWPATFLRISSKVYLPEKQRRASGRTGTEPARSGAMGPSPCRASFTSMMRPLQWAPTEMPPPRCTTMRFSWLYGVPQSAA